jgi:hypothetical protein
MSEVMGVNSHYHLFAANVRAGRPPGEDIDREEEFLEIYYESPMHKLMCLEDHERVHPQDGEYAVEHVYKAASKHKNKAFKKAVVDRPDSNLTPQDSRAHWPEVAAATKKELATWVEMGCIQRKPRSQSRNVIDVRWVLKWKYDIETKGATESGDTKGRWVIRARLCLRGFKDIDARTLDSYAGTAARHTQRLLVSEAVCRGWDIVSVDISKAFLQGVTYKELAEATGEPLREVNFYLPEYSVAFLRLLPGWESFDPRYEVINCIKPGTGCNDAPRCFSLKLAKITRDTCGLVACTVDGELCMKHDANKNLIALMAKHVDDLKMAGLRDIIIKIIQLIEQVFGKLKIEWNNFTNCGVRHTQDPKTKGVIMDQNDYVKGIKLCESSDLSAKGIDTLCDTPLHHQYWSVLGAVAYAVMTRPDIAVFVAALQRCSHAPKIIHCKRLNAVIRWAQRNPKGIAYNPFDCKATHLRMISDAAFKREEDSGHSMRGACYVRCPGVSDNDFVISKPGHLIETVARQQRRVTRATFTSELQGGCDTMDKGFLLLQALDEMQTGRISAQEAMERRNNGGFAVPGAIYLDALSVYAAITATFVKTPADNGVLIHCLYIRELLDYAVLHALIWQDTRDMLADGLTKGVVDRQALHDAMDGLIKIHHECKFWRPKHLTRSKIITTLGEDVPKQV